MLYRQFQNVVGDMLSAADRCDPFFSCFAPGRMVSFSCHCCGDVVKKPKVLTHAKQCGTAAYSCVDCNVTFDLKTVQDHNQCVTEVDRYQGKWLEKAKSLPKQKRPERPKMSFSDTDLDDEDAKAAKPSKRTKVEPAATPEPIDGAVTVEGFELGSVEEVASLVKELAAQESGVSEKKLRKAVHRRLVTEVYAGRLAKQLGAAIDKALAGKGPIGGIAVSANGDFSLVE